MAIRFDALKYHLIEKKVTIAPLVTFRILYGLLMFFSIIRFWVNGWIRTQYIDPTFYFPFIDGIRPLEGIGMYVVFALMAVTSLSISLGLFYRISAPLFFCLFTYVELIDKTNYLNHYYFISLISFLMIWLPVHRCFSLDVWRKAVQPMSEIPVFLVNIIKVQIGVVYFFAGIAKINSDWLINAQPMKLWLSSRVHLPVIGDLFRYQITAYLFSWFGMFFDTLIPFLLWIKKTLPYAYTAVLIFHLFTGWLFPIGVFPYVMILVTTIFFPYSFHEKIIRWLSEPIKSITNTKEYIISNSLRGFILIYLIIQIAVPLRYLFHSGNIFWNELGYRFSWRVMLMEKAGGITFWVEDSDKKVMVANYEYLTPQQEKMMSTQPDMILQFVRFLEEDFQKRGFENPKITAESIVTLNGRPSKPFVKSNTDLTRVSRNDVSSYLYHYE